MTTAAPAYATPTADSPARPPADDNRLSGRVVLLLVGGVLLLTAGIAYFVFPTTVDDGERYNFYADALAFLAALLMGVPLIVQALIDLWRGTTRMNELAALSVAAAIAAGMYFTAGAIAFFMILSVLIETRTALGARKTIEALLRLTPEKAMRLADDGSETLVEAKDLRPGDLVRVRPGDNLPGDGTVVRGHSSVNQANITGESVPADKAEGDEVFGGTTNLTGALDVRITKAGADTTLGRVQDLVLHAEQTKTPTQRMADLYAAWHTPVILMLAAVLWFFTNDAGRVIALLVIAAPSSIILATPTALVAALSAAARLGLLVKNVADLESARKITAVVFDKTGTLTTGKLTVSRLGPIEGVEPAELLSAAAAVEQNSNHPAAKAVMEIAKKARVTPGEVDRFEEVGGRGVFGTVGGEEILVGRATWLNERGVSTDAGEAPPEGLSLLHVAKGGRLLGWIGLEDKARTDAAAAVDELRDQNVRQVVMVTGDRWSVANRVAAELHCTDVQAEVLPGEKLQVVDGLRQKGHVIAVVGDGVNDAPALKAGDLSIAMGAAGSDVAINSASVALMNNRLDRIPFLVRLSRATGRVILQGIGFSIAYIAVFGALAAAGYLPPVAAALLHTLSSIFVVFNSARLVREGEEIDVVEPETPVRPTITPTPVRAAAA